MLRKVYPGRQVECINSNQHKIDHKIKGVNDDNGETREEENITQDERKTENEAQECDLKFMSITGMMRNMNKTRKTLKSKKRKMQNQKITKWKKLKRTKRS